MFTHTTNPAAAYRSGGIEAEALGSSPHGLIVMLFNGALLSINLAKAHMLEGKTSAKAESINKAIDIIGSGLRAALNIKEGGELAQNLDDLYEYIVMLLLKANLNNDATILDEAYRLLADIGSAWTELGQKQATAKP
ncbi:flagellar export chaperone FliS [Denitromonas halophila]|uniref:Flagellar secretion chaperone FliS n=1 Tax=Denitromonas halophila TaxID=1629404 RepID=A0A557QZH5_9RHOO|nr:flagellar export chaperone FliS [Denitromonas halophila]TVO58266.1 flagellar export chaperone FliS [Denitromonas halophila]